MSVEVNLFVGRRDGGDLEDLFQNAQARGFIEITFREEASRLITKTRATQVTIKGGLAGVCVPITAEEALKLGVQKVVIPIKDIRLNKHDGPTDDPYTLRTRKDQVRSGIRHFRTAKSDMSRSDRLIFID